MQETTPCPNCGSQNPSGYQFCGKCGGSLQHIENRFASPTATTYPDSTVSDKSNIDPITKVEELQAVEPKIETISTTERDSASNSSWKGGLASIYYSLVSFPAAGLAWGLMWVTDRLYEGGWWWFIAVPIRIIIFLMQLGVLLGCLGSVVGIVWVTVSIFYRASRGQDLDGESTLSVKGYMLFLLLPVAMVIASLLVALFQDWLNFNEHGLGLIALGYLALYWVLGVGSLVIIGIWLVILPIFLRKRKRNLCLKRAGGAVRGEDSMKKSNMLGILSLAFGVIGIFWWSAVMGIIAIILGIVQFARHRSRLAIAGLVLGVIDILLAVFWYRVGLMPSIF